MMLLEDKTVKLLETRAASAVNGYAADENITCYTYGRDVVLLLNERRELLVELNKWKTLAEDREQSQATGGRPPSVKEEEPAKEEDPAYQFGTQQQEKQKSKDRYAKRENR